MPTGLHSEFRQRQQLGRAVAVGSGRRLGNFEVEYRAVRARDAATKAQHGRPLRRVVMHREDQAAQQRAPVDAVSHVAVAPGSAANDLPQSRPSPACGSGAGTPSVACPLALVKSTWKLRGHAPPCGMLTQRRIDLRKALKKASLKHTLACGATKSDQSSSPSVARTCSATRLNSPLQRYCACLRAILDSLTGWAGWYARRQ